MSSSVLRTVGGSSPKLSRGSMARASLPPGFRFHPTDVELIMYYLKRKVLGKKLEPEAIAEVNIYSFSPWDLPDKSCLRNKDQEWFFFCPRQRKYSSGVRVKRATENGYWKTTGKERTVIYNDRTVGSVKTLIFHLGHAPKGERTDWVIHEYRIIDEQLVEAGVQDTYVLCKLFKKSGLGPKNGAQYGAPFDEAEWDHDDDDVIDSQCPSVSFMSCGPSCAPVVSENQSAAAKDLLDTERAPELSLTEDGLIENQVAPKPLDNIGGTSRIPLMDGAQSALEVHPKALDNIASTSRVPMIEGASPASEDCPKTLDNTVSISVPATNESPLDMTEDEIFCLLSAFTDDNSLLAGGDGCHKVGNGNRGDQALRCLDGNDIFNGLGDLDNCSVMNDGRSSMLDMHTDDHPLNNLLPQDNFGFIELDDLLAPLDNSTEVMGTDRLHATFGSYYNENMQQFFPASSSRMNPYDNCESQMSVLPSGTNYQLPGLHHGSNYQLPVLPSGCNNHQSMLSSGLYNQLSVLPNQLPVLPNQLPVLPSGSNNQLPVLPYGSNNQLPMLPYGSSNQLSVLPNGSSNQLSVLPNGSNNNTSLDAIQMINGFYSGNTTAVHDFEFAQSQLVNGDNMDQLSDEYTQRGKQICAPGLLESTPSCSPIAARRCAPMFCSCYGSSIHIKAEVTYGTGECTKEALSGMMEESSSFLWNHPWADVPLLLHSVDFGSRLFLCYISVFAYRLYLCHFSGRNSRKVFCSIYFLSNMTVVFTKLLIVTCDHEMNDFFRIKNVTKYLCPFTWVSSLLCMMVFYNFATKCSSSGIWQVMCSQLERFRSTTAIWYSDILRL